MARGARSGSQLGRVRQRGLLNPFKAEREDGGAFLWFRAAREGGYAGSVVRLRERDERAGVACERRRSSLQLLRSATVSSLGEPAGIFGAWWEEQREVLGML